jgi:hypothetical protein
MIDKQLGIMSPIDMIMDDNPDLTREDAEKRFEQVKKDIEMYMSAVSAFEKQTDKETQE